MQTEKQSKNPFTFEEWECPICGKAETLVVHSDTHSGENSLKVHIHETKGNGHGPKYEYPEGYTKKDDLGQYVETV